MSTYVNRPAEEFINDPALEGLWACKAVEHMNIHFNLISSVSPKILKLTPKDDEIYKEFRSQFPDLVVGVLNIDDLKSEEAKNKWRPFCNSFEEVIEDFNYATLLRIDSTKDYSDDNTIVVPRIQFLAIEIARNREGLNESIRQNFGKKTTETENGKDSWQWNKNIFMNNLKEQ